MIVRLNHTCVQESWLKPNLSYVVQGYEVVQKDRINGNGGGVATLVKLGIASREVKVNEEYETVVIDVRADNCNIRVINFYNPCKRLNTDLTKNIGVDGNSNIVWCGDFNAHSTLWGCENNDQNGNVIEKFLDCNDFVCLNDGNITRVDVIRGRNSVIDLTILSNNLSM